ncbi:hypothetical protein CLOSTMETH_03416 [[Clostridium] methylpentosum DSM 5476]|uniref:Uncharacterized protein n=1 Tax=[Clostridium] methylpentosum DSM 5476 TaxID=537013 RepID=C0EHS1_9FIRM|nr:hypothetical protein CLOSTMETH_03416 [[Clostridium] methylpentosum DSM 5476]
MFLLYRKKEKIQLKQRNFCKSHVFMHFSKLYFVNIYIFYNIQTIFILFFTDFSFLLKILRLSKNDQSHENKILSS